MKYILDCIINFVDLKFKSHLVEKILDLHFYSLTLKLKYKYTLVKNLKYKLLINSNQKKIKICIV